MRDGSDQPQQPVDLSSLLAELINQSTRQSEWRLQGNLLDSAWVLALPVGLKRALQNLMSNAETHAQAPFEIVLARHQGRISLRILDRGPGMIVGRAITAETAAAPTEASARKSMGYGLGLSIAERALHLDGATLSMVNRNDGGLEVCMSFGER